MIQYPTAKNRSARGFVPTEPIINRWQPTNPSDPSAGSSAESLPPEASAADLLRVMIGQLDVLIADSKRRIPRGLALASTIAVGSIVPVEMVYDPPLFNLVVTCDGPGIVQFRMPNQGGADWIAMNPTEQVLFSFPEGLIGSIAFRVQGAATVVRLIGTY